MLVCGCGDKKITETVVEKPAVSGRKLDVLDVDISTATRASIAVVLTNENSTFVRKINKWEEIWSVGPAFKDASQLKLGFTEEGALAYFQLKYPFGDVEVNTQKIVDGVEKQHGKPSVVKGSFEVGDYEAKWDTGDGLSISVVREWPNKYTNVTYFNDTAYDTLKLEYRIDVEKSIYKRKIF